MATISSTLRIQDGFTAPIQKGIDAMNRIIDTMEQLDRASNQPLGGHAFDSMRTDVSLADHALEQLNRELYETEGAAQSAARAAGSFGGLGRAIVVANQGLELLQRGWSAISGLGNRADERSSVDARMSLINDGLRTQEQLERQVMAAANDSRATYESTAALVARMGRQDYFRGNNDAAIAFASTLNKGLVVSGTSAVEAESALLQLSQGLASGVLRGEEFNSIMENAPVLAEMMCASLGVTKGELRSMAGEQQLTAEVVVGSIMRQSEAIEQQFNDMPMTFGQASNIFGNYISELMDRLSQPGQAVDILIVKIGELSAWAGTAQGTAFFDGIAMAVTFAVECISWLGQSAAEVYQFFSENWPTIEPIMWGIAAAVGFVTLAYLAYLGVSSAIALVKGIEGSARMLAAGATMAETVAQYSLNAALLACPITWIIIGIGLMVAAFVYLWQSSIDFRVGFLSNWNMVLSFFDGVPLFFMGVGYGIADAFSYAKSMTFMILDSLVNGAIDRINALISFVNQIPSVSIDTIEHVSFAADVALQEEANRAGRAAAFAEKSAAVAEKAAEREQKLAADAQQWRAEASAKEQERLAQQAEKEPVYTGGADSFLGGYGDGSLPVNPTGGSLDKVGEIGNAIDISNTSLEYLRDIAELQALESVNAEASISYNLMDEARLRASDADLLRSSAGSSTNVYYLNYSTGGVRIKSNVRRGENWEEIRKNIYDEAEADIQTGLSGLEEAVLG